MTSQCKSEATWSLTYSGILFSTGTSLNLNFLRTPGFILEFYKEDSLKQLQHISRPKIVICWTSSRMILRRISPKSSIPGNKASATRSEARRREVLSSLSSKEQAWTPEIWKFRCSEVLPNGVSAWILKSGSAQSITPTLTLSKNRSITFTLKTSSSWDFKTK